MADHSTTTRENRYPLEIEVTPPKDETMSTTSFDSDLQEIDIEEASPSSVNASASYQRVYRRTMLIFFAVCIVIACVTIVPTAFSYVEWEEQEADATSKTPLIELLTKVVVFGDSVSDTGNVYSASNQTVPETPPYWEGRYSNGQIYVDFLQNELKTRATVENYAWGGATTSSNLISGYSTFMDGPVPSVNEQIASYLQDSQKTLQMDDDDSTLYVMASGYNDYWWWVYHNLEDSSAEVSIDDQLDALVENVTTALIRSVETLASESRVQEHPTRSHFLIFNLPPMVDFPEAANHSTAKKLAYRLITDQHNELLAAKVKALERTTTLAKDTTLQLLDIHNLYSNALNDPVLFGFDPLQGETPIACLSQLEDKTVCEDSFASIFWDMYHPTTHFHFLIFEEILKLLGAAI